MASLNAPEQKQFGVNDCVRWRAGVLGMGKLGRQSALWMVTSATLLISACGGGGGGGSTPPPVTPPAVSSVTVTPNPATAVIGTTIQFAAAVAGSAVTDKTVAWSVAAPAGSTLS